MRIFPFFFVRGEECVLEDCLHGSGINCYLPTRARIWREQQNIMWVNRILPYNAQHFLNVFEFIHPVGGPTVERRVDVRLVTTYHDLQYNAFSYIHSSLLKGPTSKL